MREKASKNNSKKNPPFRSAVRSGRKKSRDVKETIKKRSRSAEIQIGGSRDGGGPRRRRRGEGIREERRGERTVRNSKAIGKRRK